MSIVLDGDNLTSSGVPNTRTAQATTSGTSIDFTSIPSGTKRITVVLNGISSNGSSGLLVQIGAGSVTSSGYTSYSSRVATSNQTSATGVTNGFLLQMSGATNTFSGIATIAAIGGNIWVCSGTFSDYAAGATCQTGGNVTLGGTLDRVRLTTYNGTDAFDAGSVNILYE